MPGGLVAYTCDTSATVEMTYNAMYQRVQKAVDGGQTTRFIYDHKRLLAETDETDTTTRSFTSGTAGPNSEYGDLVSEYDAQSLEEVSDRGYKAPALYTAVRGYKAPALYTQLANQHNRH